jgi:HSP20 family protein
MSLLKNDFFDPLDMRQDIIRQDMLQLVPRMDLVETKDTFQVKADVPGFKKDQIDIDIQGNTLCIRGRYDNKMEQNDQHYHAQERIQSSFARSLMLPCAVEPAQVKAELKDGVLQVVVPKNGKTSKINISSL